MLIVLIFQERLWEQRYVEHYTPEGHSYRKMHFVFKLECWVWNKAYSFVTENKIEENKNTEKLMVVMLHTEIAFAWEKTLH